MSGRGKKKRVHKKQHTVSERFWQKVGRSPSGCWDWTAARDRCGYGRLKVDGGIKSAHRLSWVLANGPIPDGLHVCHTCDNPGCVNPVHLFVTDHRGNMADMAAKGRSPRGVASRSAKLTRRDILAIRADDRLQRIIAEKYGVQPQTISSVKRRLTWGWVK
jgi:hypothetical protein